jgi:hypothetical protein
MSGFEVAGLVLAIFSATVQCLGGRKAITGVVRCSAEFKNLNRKTRMKLFLQEKHFTYQCQKLREYLGDAFDETTTAIELVLLEFDAIRKLLDKSDSPRSGVSASESVSYQTDLEGTKCEDC